MNLFPVVMAATLLGSTSSVFSQTLTYTDSLDPFLTQKFLKREFQLPGFNPALGTLNSVSIDFQSNITSSIKFEYLGALTPGPPAYDPYLFELLSFHAGSGLQALGANTVTTDFWIGSSPIIGAWSDNSLLLPGTFESLATFSEVATPAVYDGITDFGGTSGFTRTYSSIADLNHTQTLIDGASLGYFTNPTVSLYEVSGVRQTQLTLGGNEVTEYITEVQSAVTVTYNFTPIPEPSSALLGCLAGALAVLRRKRQS